MKTCLFATAVLLVALGSNSGFAQSPDAIAWKPYTFTAQDGTEVDAERGVVQVRENRQAAGSRMIPLTFVRFKSTHPTPGAPIVYLAGGPGGSGIATARGPRFPLFMALRSTADVIALDQRGTGASNIIPACEHQADIPLETPGTPDGYLAPLIEAARRCLAFWHEEGVSVESYNTIESAGDVEALRRALGVPRLTLWGISYGSHLAFSYVKHYESSVDRLILAGLEGPDHTIKLPLHNQHMLERLAEALAQDPQASLQYPDLLSLMRSVLAPLAEKPVTVEVKHPQTGQPLRVGISAFDVQAVTSLLLLKNPEDSRKLPAVYAQMAQGNFSQMGMMVAMLRLFARETEAMPLAMDAMSGVSPERWALIQDQAPHAMLGRTTNFPFPDLGQALPFRDLGAGYWTNPQSEVPALFFSGTLDGRTYLESAEELLAGFPNAAHIVIEGAGHDLFMSTNKVEDLMLAFLQGTPVSSHTVSLPPMRFVVP